MGRKSQDWATHLGNSKLLKCSHPASAAYSGGTWDSNDVFEKANEELIKQDKACINW